jgi:hypothetical protein
MVVSHSFAWFPCKWLISFFALVRRYCTTAPNPKFEKIEPILSNSIEK